ncbi:MAG: hypothetical protein EAZ21_11300 [Betaproteobacteria bacterium]|nr:MAG: hypothetical protein EAZ21_11300 [Betaproteobacteria bacterium]
MVHAFESSDQVLRRPTIQATLKSRRVTFSEFFGAGSAHLAEAALRVVTKFLRHTCRPLSVRSPRRPSRLVCQLRVHRNLNRRIRQKSANMPWCAIDRE